MGLGWQLLASDFWRLWVVGFVFVLVTWAANMVGQQGAVPVTILVTPPLLAGMYYVIAQRVDGGEAEVGALFRGFKDRFAESVVAYLPVSLGSLVLIVAIVVSAWLLTVLIAMLAAAAEGDDAAVGLAVVAGGLVLAVVEGCLLIALALLHFFFTFMPAVVWDHPGAGWEAAKAAVRLVRDHVISVLGFAVLFGLADFAAIVVGVLTCGLGLVFLAPAIEVWRYATLVYLYRSWTGREAGAAAVTV
jgi:hypothetical protein